MIINLKHIIVIFSFIILFISCTPSSRYANSIDRSKENVNERGNKIHNTKIGTASFYGNEFNGRRTANGEIYNMNELTAAHPSYPFNTLVKVVNIKNGKSVEVRINDRMPQFKNRIIDLSLAAARKIDMINDGIQEVKLEVIKWGSE